MSRLAVPHGSASMLAGVFIGVLILAGCGGHEDSDYFPLVKGAERTMRVWTRTVAAGETTETDEVRVVERVAGEQEVEGVGRVWVVETPRDSGPAARVFFRKSEDAVRQVVAGRDSLPVELLFLSLPLTPGLRWYDTERQGQVSEVTARDTVVIGPDTFPDCYEVVTRSARESWSGRLWLAPDAGPVMWERYWVRTGRDGSRVEVQQRAELVRYERPKEEGPIP